MAFSGLSTNKLFTATTLGEDISPLLTRLALHQGRTAAHWAGGLWRSRECEGAFGLDGSWPAFQTLASLPVKEIITTDTVPMSPEAFEVLGDRLTVLSVAPLIGEVIRRAHEGRSVGEMFHE